MQPARAEHGAPEFALSAYTLALITSIHMALFKNLGTVLGQIKFTRHSRVAPCLWGDEVTVLQASEGAELQTLSDLPRTICLLLLRIFPLLRNHPPTEQRFHRFAVKLKHIFRAPNKKTKCPQCTQIKNHSKYTTGTFPTDDNLWPVPANRMGGSQLPAWAISRIKQYRQPWLKERATWIKPIDKRRPPIPPEVYF